MSSRFSPIIDKSQNKCFSCRKIICSKYNVCYQCYLKPNNCKLCFKKINADRQLCYNCRTSPDNKEAIKKLNL